jgi:hypothetical protein
MITFVEGTSTLGSVALNGGTARFNISSLPTGKNAIIATYSGDSNYGKSSSTLMQTVKLGSTMALSSSANPVVEGASLFFTATVSPCCQATGTVTFFDGSGTLGVGMVKPPVDPAVRVPQGILSMPQETTPFQLHTVETATTEHLPALWVRW